MNAQNTVTEVHAVDTAIEVSSIGILHFAISDALLDAKYVGCGRAFAVVGRDGVVDFEYANGSESPSKALSAKGHVYTGMLSCCRFCIE